SSDVCSSDLRHSGQFTVDKFIQRKRATFSSTAFVRRDHDLGDLIFFNEVEPVFWLFNQQGWIYRHGFTLIRYTPGDVHPQNTHFRGEVLQQGPGPFTGPIQDDATLELGGIDNGQEQPAGNDNQNSSDDHTPEDKTLVDEITRDNQIQQKKGNAAEQKETDQGPQQHARITFAHHGCVNTHRQSAATHDDRKDDHGKPIEHNRIRVHLVARDVGIYPLRKPRCQHQQ